MLGYKQLDSQKDLFEFELNSKKVKRTIIGFSLLTFRKIKYLSLMVKASMSQKLKMLFIVCSWSEKIYGTESYIQEKYMFLLEREIKYSILSLLINLIANQKILILRLI